MIPSRFFSLPPLGPGRGSTVAVVAFETPRMRYDKTIILGPDWSHAYRDWEKGKVDLPSARVSALYGIVRQGAGGGRVLGAGVFTVLFSGVLPRGMHVAVCPCPDLTGAVAHWTSSPWSRRWRLCHRAARNLGSCRASAAISLTASSSSAPPSPIPGTTAVGRTTMASSWLTSTAISSRFSAREPKGLSRGSSPRRGGDAGAPLTQTGPGMGSRLAPRKRQVVRIGFRGVSLCAVSVEGVP